MATRKFYEMMGGFGGETDYKKLYYRECNVTSQLREELEAAKKEIEEIKNIVEKEPVAFLLSNALRLPKERLEALTEALIERTDCGTNLKKEIERLKELLKEASYRLTQAIDVFNGSSGLETGDGDKYIKMVDCVDKIQKNINPGIRE